MLRIHRVQCPEMTQISLYHRCSRVEHPRLETAWSRLCYCHKITIVHQKLDLVSGSLSQILQMLDLFFP
jgi:hypothetical protein